MLSEKDKALVDLLYDVFIKQTKLAVSGVLPADNTEVSYKERNIHSGEADVSMNCETTMSYDSGYEAVFKKFDVRLVRDPDDVVIEFSISWPPRRERYVLLQHYNVPTWMHEVLHGLLNKLNSAEGKAEITEIWNSSKFKPVQATLV